MIGGLWVPMQAVAYPVGGETVVQAGIRSVQEATTTLAVWDGGNDGPAFLAGAWASVR